MTYASCASAHAYEMRERAGSFGLNGTKPPLRFTRTLCGRANHPREKRLRAVAAAPIQRCPNKTEGPGCSELISYAGALDGARPHLTNPPSYDATFLQVTSPSSLTPVAVSPLNVSNTLLPWVMSVVFALPVTPLLARSAF